MLKASNNWPWLAAPSPYSATHMFFLPRYFKANAMPAPRGTWDAEEEGSKEPGVLRPVNHYSYIKVKANK